MSVYERERVVKEMSLFVGVLNQIFYSGLVTKVLPDVPGRDLFALINWYLFADDTKT
mgnify:CR=1 FL=1